MSTAAPVAPEASGPVPSGLAPALGAYLIWGFLPLYLMLVQSVPPFEFVGWRIIWTLPLCLLIVLFRRQFPELLAALKSPRSLLALTASAVLIGINWFVYIWAIMAGEVYATSIGYYLNPLVNVLLGTLVLGEKLSKRQWLAVAIAAVAVALLAAGALTSLWISLSLGFSFGLYGLVRKQVAVGSLPGLTIESAILLPIAVAIGRGVADVDVEYVLAVVTLSMGQRVVHQLKGVGTIVAERAFDVISLGLVFLMALGLQFNVIEAGWNQLKRFLQRHH